MSGKSSDLSGKWITIGVIGAPHGIKGAVNVISALAQPADLRTFSPLMLNDGRELEVTNVRPGKNAKVVASFKGVTTRDQAQSLTHEHLRILRERLPKLKGNNFYYADLIGLNALTIRHEKLGEVIAVHNFGASDVLEIKTDSNTFMVAFTKNFVPKVDLDAGALMISDSALEGI